MQHAFRPRRSMLYVPGDNKRYLEKARELDADSLVFDLEDSVALDFKENARKNVYEALQKGGFIHQELVVRINGLQTPWCMDDLAAFADHHSLDAVLISQVNSAEEVLETIENLDSCGGKHLPVMVMIETPLAILRAESIAGCSDRLCCLVMGTSDLASAIYRHDAPDRTAVQMASMVSLFAARAFNLSILDGSHTELEDPVACELSCRQARDMGFDGKTVVHPRQLPYTNDAFTPRKYDLEKAKEIIDVYEKAQSVGKGVAIFNGRIVEPHKVDAARRLLELNDAISAISKK